MSADTSAAGEWTIEQVMRDYQHGYSGYVALVAAHNAIVAALREQLAQAIKERDYARRDERQHWTDFERAALEAYVLKTQLAQAQKALKAVIHPEAPQP